MASRYTRVTPILSGWPIIFVMSAIGLLLGVLLSFLRPLEYSSTTRLLITQQLGAVDAYTASRSAERVAEDLATAVFTSTFLDKVLLDEDVDASYFPSDENRKRTKWNRIITTSVSRSTGFLTIRVYHPDVDQAEVIARTVVEVLISDGYTYTSGGNISVQLVDSPLNSRFPVRPNIPVNAFSGFVLGGLAGVGYILIQVERSQRRHQLVHVEG